MNIGFSNGDFWPVQSHVTQRFGEGFLTHLYQISDSLIELHCLGAKIMRYFAMHDLPQIYAFHRVTLHMPDSSYDDNDATQKICDKNIWTHI